MQVTYTFLSEKMHSQVDNISDETDLSQFIYFLIRVTHKKIYHGLSSTICVL